MMLLEITVLIYKWSFGTENRVKIIKDSKSTQFLWLFGRNFVSLQLVRAFFGFV